MASLLPLPNSLSTPFLFLCLLLLFFSPALSSPPPDDVVSTYIFRVHAQSKPSVFPTHSLWYSSLFPSLTILHVYHTVFHGFSASLSSHQAASLLHRPYILAVFQDCQRHLHTTRSPQFLGLRNQHGLWSHSDYGSDVIIGIFDAGIGSPRLESRCNKVGVDDNCEYK